MTSEIYNLKEDVKKDLYDESKDEFTFDTEAQLLNPIYLTKTIRALSKVVNFVRNIKEIHIGLTEADQDLTDAISGLQFFRDQATAYVTDHEKRLNALEKSVFG